MVTEVMESELELVVLDELDSDPFGDDCMLCPVCNPVDNTGEIVKTLCGKSVPNIIIGECYQRDVPCDDCKAVPKCPSCGSYLN